MPRLPRASSRGSASPSIPPSTMGCWLRIIARMVWSHLLRARVSRGLRTGARLVTGSARHRVTRTGACHFLLFFVREHHDETRGFLDAHRGVIDKDRIGGAHERRDSSFAVAPIALIYFVENLGERECLTLFLVFLPAAFGARFRRSVQENLQLRVGENDGADIASLHDHAATGAGALLLGDKNAAHLGNRSELRSRLRNVRGADLARHFPAIE